MSGDLLHQLIKGTFNDHLIVWILDYIKMAHGLKEAEEIRDEIDRW